MIQRFQSVLLLLAAAANFAVFFLPYGYSANHESMESPRARMYANHLEKRSLITSTDDMKSFGKDTVEIIGAGDNMLVLIHTILVVSTTLFLVLLIFLYGNRQRQAQLAYFGMGALMLQITLSAALMYSVLPDLVGGNDPNITAGQVEMGPQYGFFVPLVSLLLVWWASKRIHKDERMVRDSNRLR